LVEGCFISVGLSRVYAVRLIREAFVRYKFHSQIRRLRQAYDDYMRQKTYEVSAFINKSGPVFAARCKVMRLRQRQHKKRTLLKVRRGLAILVIAKHWRKHRLNFKAMQIKIVRYRRKLEAASKRKALLGRQSGRSPKIAMEASTPQTLKFNLALSAAETYQASGESTMRGRDSITSDRFKEGFSKAQDNVLAALEANRYESDEEDRLEAELQQQAREQIELRKVSYNIPHYTDKLRLPCLKERTIYSSIDSARDSSVRPDSNLFTMTVAMSSKMRMAERAASIGPMIRSTLITAPPTAPSRYRPGHLHSLSPMSLSMPLDEKLKLPGVTTRSWFSPSDLEEPSYMRATTASKGARWTGAKPVMKKRKLKKINTRRLNFSCDTKKPDEGQVDTKEPWRFAVPREPFYTPGLGNTRYKTQNQPRSRYCSSRPSTHIDPLPELSPIEVQSVPHPLSGSFKNASAEFFDLLKEQRPLTQELTQRITLTQPSSASSNRPRL
jgi:hypothetical protein